MTKPTLTEMDSKPTAVAGRHDDQKKQPSNGQAKGKAQAAKVADKGRAGNRLLKTAYDLPRSWEEIKVGDLVIAQESPKDGWWEGIVVVVNDDTLTIKWRDYPKYRQQHRNRFSVALLYSKQ